MCRLKIIVYLLLLCIQSQAQDFRVENFRENLNDLTAALAGIKDLNKKDAALLRFSVRDNKFELEPNFGILKQENATGEIRLFVPEGTKRITIRHPLLGILRDYTLPIAIKSKATYDADIIITNSEYLQALFGNDYNEIPTTKESETQKSPLEETLFEELEKEESVFNQETPSSQNNDISDIDIVKTELSFFAGVGFNALSAIGPSLHIGINYKSICLEAGYVFGIDQVKDVNFSRNGQSTVIESYDYSASKLWLRLGYMVGSKIEKFNIEPQAGVSFNLINGKSKGSYKTDYFKKSTPMSIFAGLRFSYVIIKDLYVFVTPQYDLALSGDDVYSIIKTADNKIKSWGEGFGVNVGVLYRF